VISLLVFGHTVCGQSTQRVSIRGEKSVHLLIQEGHKAEAILRITEDPSLVKSTDDYTRTPLHLAARFGDAELVQFLIDKDADLNATSYNNFTPLHVCGTPEAAQLLVRAGADTTLIDSWRKTALQSAALMGRTEVAEAMIQAGATVDLLTATALGDKQTATELARANPGLLNQLGRGHSLNRSESPLGIAAQDGDLELVKLYVELGANVNAVNPRPMGEGYSPLVNAVNAGNKDIVRFLVSKGADVNVKVGKSGVPLLQCVRESGDKEMIAALEGVQPVQLVQVHPQPDSLPATGDESATVGSYALAVVTVVIALIVAGCGWALRSKRDRTQSPRESAEQ